MAKSLQQFVAWATTTRSVSNPTTNPANYYKGECVSLIQQYINQVFGIPYAARGHAWSYTPPASHFKQLPANTKLQPGDIIRYGTNYGWGYGHIGMIADDGRYFDQNGVVSRATGFRAKPYGDIRAVFRPTKKFAVKTPKPPAPKPKTPTRKTKNGTATVIVDKLNVRDGASTKNKVVASYKKGEKFNYDSYIDANGYRWLSYVSYSGKRRYVAQRTANGKTKFLNGGV